jgi:hypothetical protein
MSAKDVSGNGEAGFARSGDRTADRTLLSRKSVLMGILTSGLVIAKAAQPSSAEAGTINPIAATQPPYAPKWTPSTQYVLGQQVISPNNDVVSANSSHTSSSAYSTDTTKWTLSSTFASKGTEITVTSGRLSDTSLTAAFVGRDSLVLNVLDHGMAVGQNISAALGTLLSTLSAAGGGTVYVPPGTFYAANVNLASNVTVKMAPGSVLKLPNASTANGIFLLPAGVTNVSLIGPGTLDGNRANYGAGSQGDGICGLSNTASGLTVTGVKFVNMPLAGILLTGVANVSITGCSFVGMSLHAIICYGGNDVQISNNFVDRSGDSIVADNASIQYWIYAGQSWSGPVITDNRVIGKVGTGAENAFIGIGVNAQGATAIVTGGVVSGNVVRNGSMGFSFNWFAGTISNNTVYGVDYTGIELVDCHGATVVGNNINGGGNGNGIMINQTGTNLVITGNRVANWADTYSNGGIFVNGTSVIGCTFSNNIFSGTYGRATPLSLNNIKESTVTGNVVRIGVTADLPFIWVNATQANCDDNIISANVISAAGTSMWTSGMLLVKASTGRSCSRNMIIGNSMNGPTGLGVVLNGTSAASIIGTIVLHNGYANINTALTQTNATGTVTT